jgi:thioredoxin-like negative regulator of GroEL
MKINKSSSPLWVRIMVWILAGALIAGTGILAVSAAIQQWSQQPAPIAGNENLTPEEAQAKVGEIDARYQPKIDELQKTAEAKPDDKNALIELASAFTQWATELSMIQDNNAQMMAMLRISQSREPWEKAYGLDKTDTEVGGEFATALYYSGDTTQAVTVAREVLKAAPEFGIMWFNLGQFLTETKPQEALEAFETAIKYDSENQYTAQAQQYIDGLKAEK